MSDITITSDWTPTSDYERQYAETSDPRVLAVIVRDDEPDAPDYDAQAPTLMAYEYGSRASFVKVGSTDDGGVRDAWLAARDRLMHDELIRYMRVFHGTTVHHLSSSIDQYSWALVFDTPVWRKAMGIEPETELTSNDVAGDVKAYLDGDVYGIGWATLEGRVLPSEEPIDLDEWDQNIECWGFYGEDYAKEVAAGFEYGKPDLPEMLEVA